MSAGLERSLLILALVAILLLLLLDRLLRQRGKPPWRPVAAGFAAVISLLLAAIAGRWLREAQGPFLTLYDVLLSNLFSLGLVYLVAALLVPSFRESARFVLGFLLLLAAWSLRVSPESIPLPATFNNPWLWMHVLSGKLFLGLCLAAAATAALLLSNRDSADKAWPDQDALDAAVWLAMSLAFVCHSFMLIAGAVWAHSAWGRYWAWDPLETWTLVTWLVIALTLHARVTFRHFPATAGWSAAILIFGLAVLTFLGVPFLSLAPHKGVM